VPALHFIYAIRDIEYLLNLCESLGLWVIAAPGPYVCAESSGGGFPTWLIAKRGVRIRHQLAAFVKLYDARFMAYCEEWFRHIIPLLAAHELTTNVRAVLMRAGAGEPWLTAPDAPAYCLAFPGYWQPHGCIVACQIENEMLESNVTTMLRFDFARYIRELAQMARRHGCTVPLLHNDPMLSASFVPGIGGNGMDLYAFDQYITHPPVRNVGKSSWSQTEFAQAIDSIERTVRGYGGGATTGPIIVAELQGGWFNPVRARMGGEGAVRWSALLMRVAVCVD